VNGSDIFLSDIHQVMTLPVLVVFRVSNCCFLIDMHAPISCNDPCEFLSSNAESWQLSLHGKQNDTDVFFG
jgi:hypothetical protein